MYQEKRSKALKGINQCKEKIRGRERQLYTYIVMINMRISDKRNEVKNLMKCGKVEFRNTEPYRSYNENAKKIHTYIRKT